MLNHKKLNTKEKQRQPKNTENTTQTTMEHAQWSLTPPLCAIFIYFEGFCSLHALHGINILYCTVLYNLVPHTVFMDHCFFWGFCGLSRQTVFNLNRWSSVLLRFHLLMAAMSLHVLPVSLSEAGVEVSSAHTLYKLNSIMVNGSYLYRAFPLVQTSDLHIPARLVEPLLSNFRCLVQGYTYRHATRARNWTSNLTVNGSCTWADFQHQLSNITSTYKCSPGNN